MGGRATMFLKFTCVLNLFGVWKLMRARVFSILCWCAEVKFLSKDILVQMRFFSASYFRTSFGRKYKTKETWLHVVESYERRLSGYQDGHWVSVLSGSTVVSRVCFQIFQPIICLWFFPNFYQASFGKTNERFDFVTREVGILFSEIGSS